MTSEFSGEGSPSRVIAACAAPSLWARWLAPLFRQLSPDAERAAKATALDVSERLCVALLFGQFAYRVLGAFEHAPTLGTFLLVMSEVLPVFLILTRARSNSLSDHPVDWVLGFAGTCAPLLVEPISAQTVAPAEFCALLVLIGMFIQISGKVALWRSFGIVAANRGVKTIGPYRFVRHPIYMGYVITHIGFVLNFPSWRNLLIYVAALALQIVRLLREERLLKQDPQYREYAARVRYRLLPKVF
jgi:protein-S-isoprenylcysteine O-methyltransferase Ste14